MELKKYMDALELFLIKAEAMADTVSPEIGEVIAPLCEVLSIGKVEGVLFQSQRHEKLNKGVSINYYTSGKECSETPIIKRFVTNGFSVFVYHVYPLKDMQGDNFEQEKTELFLKMLFTFNSRDKLLKIAEELTYYDSDRNYNLRYFTRYIDQLIERKELVGYGAIFFNLKHFSIVNKQLGRNAGTVIMNKYLDEIRSVLEKGDVLCRVGGDNFTVLVKEERLNLVTGILKGVGIMDDHTKERIFISATAGVYVVRRAEDVKEYIDVMDKITLTSHIARTSGSEDIVFFDESFVADRESTMRISALFPVAIEQEEFLVYYQPKISLDGCKLAGAEALCRWLHDGKLISPAEFIPVLEQSMDICTLDFYMLDHVCKDIRRWLDMGKHVVRISVNLSRKHMTDMDLLEHILGIIDRNNVPHEYIEIELTETTTDVEFRDLKRVVSGLQKAGVSTSVDDFGIGYSSLNLIKEIPWNVLKVDKSFLPLDEDSEDSTRSIMFKYVVAMARELGLECIAEGVETKAQIEALKHNSCDLAQGFFFDRPLPVTDFEERLTTHHYTID